MAILEPLAETLDTTVAELLGIANASETEKIEAVTAVAVEETERLRKDTRVRAIYGLIMCMVLLGCLLILGPLLIERGVYDFPLRICNACISVVGFHAGYYIWIWLKYRK